MIQQKKSTFEISKRKSSLAFHGKLAPSFMNKHGAMESNSTQLFLLAELSSSSVEREPLATETISACFYGDGFGHRIPLIAGSFQTVATDGVFIAGIYIDHNIHPIFDGAGRQILITLHGRQNVVMTPQLHKRYDRYFVRFRFPTPPLPRPRPPSHPRSRAILPSISE